MKRLLSKAALIFAVAASSFTLAQPAHAWCFFFCSTPPAVTTLAPATTIDVEDAYDLIDQYPNLSGLEDELFDIAEMVDVIRAAGGSEKDVTTFLDELDKQVAAINLLDLSDDAPVTTVSYAVADYATCIRPNPYYIAGCASIKTLQKVGRAMAPNAVRAVSKWLANAMSDGPNADEVETGTWMNDVVGVKGKVHGGASNPGPDFEPEEDPDDEGHKKWWDFKRITGNSEKTIKRSLEDVKRNFTRDNMPSTVSEAKRRVVLDTRNSTRWRNLKDASEEVQRLMGGNNYEKIKEVIVRAVDGWRRFTR
jgi:hypothetical protein